MLFVQQNSGQYLSRTGIATIFNNGIEGMPLIQNIVQDQHRSTHQRVLRPGFPEELATRQLVAVTGRMQVSQLHRKIQTRHQLPGNHQSAIHDAVDNWIAVRQNPVDCYSHAIHRLFYLRGGVKAICLSHHLLDVFQIDGHTQSPKRVTIHEGGQNTDLSVQRQVNLSRLLCAGDPNGALV